MLMPQVNIYQPCGLVGDSKSLGMFQISPLQGRVITKKGGNEYFVHWLPPTGQTCMPLLYLGHSHLCSILAPAKAVP